MASGVKDGLESAMISVVNDNYNEVYHSVREGYAAGYEPEAGSFRASIDLGRVEDRLCELLGLSYADEGLAKISDDGSVQFYLSDLETEVHNINLRNSGERFYADGSVIMKIPVRFAGDVITFATFKIKCKAAYTEIF